MSCRALHISNSRPNPNQTLWSVNNYKFNSVFFSLTSFQIGCNCFYFIFFSFAFINCVCVCAPVLCCWIHTCRIMCVFRLARGNCIVISRRARMGIYFKYYFFLCNLNLLSRISVIRISSYVNLARFDLCERNERTHRRRKN